MTPRVKKIPSSTKVKHVTPAPDGKVVPGQASSLEELHLGSSGEAGPLKLKVKHAQRLVLPSDDVYDTTTDPPGRVLILTYRTFSGYQYNFEIYPTPKTRIGAEHDASNLESLFEQMGYDVESHMDRTQRESCNILLEFSRPERLRKAGCAIVVVSSHGTIGHSSFAVSDGVIHVSDIYLMFNRSNSKEVREIPKLFFFQFCRGEKIPDVRFQAGEYPPTPVSMISFFSTPEQFVSWRDKQRGSKFLSVVCEVLAEKACEDCLDDLFREVQRRYMNDAWGSTPEKWEQGFTKKFYFNPRLRECSVERHYKPPKKDMLAALASLTTDKSF